MTTRFSPAFYFFLAYAMALCFAMRPHPPELDRWNHRNAPLFWQHR
jgi:hypothetical protein